MNNNSSANQGELLTSENYTISKRRTSSIINDNEKLKYALSRLNNNNTSHSSELNSSIYGFSIDTNQVQVLTAERYKTYTFKVFRENPSPEVLENYVFTIFNDGSYDQWLVKYREEAGHQEAFSLDVIKDRTLLSGGISNLVPCLSISETITTHYSCTKHEPPHYSNSNQDCSYAGTPSGPFDSTQNSSYVIYCEGTGGTATGTPPRNNNPGFDVGIKTGGTNGEGENNGSLPEVDDPEKENPREGEMNNCLTEDGCGVVLVSFDPEEEEDPECEKIKAVLKDDQGNDTAFKDKLEDLSSTANLNLNKEKAVSQHANQTNSVEKEGTATEPEVSLDGNPTNNYIAIAHTHPAIGSGTLSVFSPADLIGYATLLNKEKASAGSFTAFLTTKKGTQYAITINDSSKFIDFFYYKIMKSKINVPYSDWQKYDDSGDNFKKLYEKYFEPKNEDRKIKESDTENDNVLKEFLNFLNEADAGISLFEATDNTFEEFKPVTLSNDEPSRGGACD